MLAANADFDNHSVDIQYIFGLTNELKKAERACYGPSNEQLDQYHKTLQCWTLDLQIIASLKTVVSLASKNTVSAEANDDSPALLQVVSGLLQNHITKTEQMRDNLTKKVPLAKSQKTVLVNKSKELLNQFNSLNEDILDYRHKILHLQGLVGRFRPSERNIDHIVKVSNASMSTEALEFEFV